MWIPFSRQDKCDNSVITLCVFQLFRSYYVEICRNFSLGRPDQDNILTILNFEIKPQNTISIMSCSLDQTKALSGIFVVHR